MPKSPTSGGSGAEFAQIDFIAPRTFRLYFLSPPTTLNLSIPKESFMQLTRESVRRRARIPLTLPIRVVCRESADYQWNVWSRLVDVSQFGAGFTLTRPIEVGRLIQLVIPLPNQLRCFDHNEPMYSVWGLVRHSALLRKDLQGSAVYRVGV